MSISLWYVLRYARYIEELDQQYAFQSHEDGEHRQKAMLSSDNQNNDDQKVLPTPREGTQLSTISLQESDYGVCLISKTPCRHPAFFFCWS